MLHFNADTHEYRDRGRLIPSVTQILAPLSNFSFVEPETLAAAQAFGTAVHRACELSDLGQLAEDDLDPALAPYLAGWRNFCRDHDCKWEEVEHQVYFETMQYAGTLDRVGTVDGARAIVDIKSGSSLFPSVGPQLAAYAHAYHAQGGIFKRYAVRLFPCGYEIKEYADPRDWAVFASLITLRQFCARNNITPYYPKEQK